MQRKNPPVVDEEGFLCELDQWDEEVAEILAQQDRIELTAEHWDIIHLTRQYYQQYKLSPAMRPLVKYLRQQLGPDQGNSLYLLRLFPDSPAKRISKIAGLPKPDNCL
jgi:tRNA 2-thiouridine synthesizing protein E